jgi:hypothetical protein
MPVAEGFRHIFEFFSGDGWFVERNAVKSHRYAAMDSDQR